MFERAGFCTAHASTGHEALELGCTAQREFSPRTAKISTLYGTWTHRISQCPYSRTHLRCSSDKAEGSFRCAHAVFVHSRERGAEVSKFVDRVVGRTPRDGESDEGEETVREAELVRDPAPPSPTVSRLAGYTASEGPKEDDWELAATPLVADENSVDYANFGEHVTSVLEAATAAAAKITADAREDARRVVERTRKEAAEAVETARQEADKASAEAEQLRAEVEQESRETTQRANAYFAKKRQEAEAETSGIVTRAKREASEHTRAAQERLSALDKNVTLTEERLRQLVGGLRDLAGRLEQLLEGQEPAPTPDATDAAPSRSLEASLKPSQQSAERLT
jgi:F0F1-type ATP synthase membrane subunit b/b'